MKSKSDKLALNAGTTALIVILIVLLLSLFSFSIWGYCGTDSAAVNLRDKFAIVQQQIERFANGSETVIVPPENPFETEVKFKKIGNGVAIDKSAIRQYVGPFSSDVIKVPYVERDSDGQYSTCLKQDDCTSGFCSDFLSTPGGPKYCINIAAKKVSEFRSSYGFIPPSFAFYPYGKSNTNYKYYNKGDLNNPDNLNVKGNNMCMRACSDTNCAAVQIGVPENCAMKKSDTLGNNNTHSCGPLSEASCTLFYNTIEESDDAYYNLYNKKLSTGRSDYLGEKYYILGETPELTPSIGFVPNGENTPIKWCPSYMPPPKGYNQEGLSQNVFNTAYGAKDDCSCSALTSDCKDPNCCKYRPLLTTDGSQAASPYFNVPINFMQRKACKAIQTSTGECCGVCEQEDGSFKFSSCEGKLKGAAGGSLTTWDTTPESSECKDEAQNDKDPSDLECYGKYLGKSFTDGRNAAIELSKCNCFFRTRACILVGIQPTCLDKAGTSVQRGCVGDPPILTTDKIRSDGIGACDDMNVVPKSVRCEYDDVGKLCKGFAYGCGPESGSLWVRDDAPIS